jgi:ABC-type transport system involved in multi-copper enzyme maturation permease subunit
VSLSALLVDNPIIRKDGLLVLRRWQTLVALGICTLAVIGISTIIWSVEEADAARYASRHIVGEDMMVGMLWLSFAIAGLLVPARASATISSERERGTLPLLMVTGLSPARIVMGKVVAIVVLALPFVALPLPAAILGAVHAHVPLEVLALTLAGLAVSAVAFAAVGVFASSLTARSQTSAPAALAAATVPGFCCALPAFLLIVEHAESNNIADELQMTYAGIVAGAVIIAASAYGAWSTLANRSAQRFVPATLLFLLVSVGLPFFAVVLGQADFVDSWRRADRHAPLVGALVFMIAGVVLYSAGLGLDRRAPAPWKIIPVALTFATVSFAGAVAALREPLDNFAAVAPEPFLVGWLQVVAMACLAATAGRFIKRPVFAAGAAASAILLLTLVPTVLSGGVKGTTTITAFLNPVFVNSSNVIVSTVFWLGVACLALATVRRSPSPVGASRTGEVEI